MNDTIFDKLIRKEIDAKIVYEDDDIFAFHDVNPQAPVHVLVIPKRKFENIAAAKDKDVNELGRYMQGIAKVAEMLELEQNGYRVVFNVGKYGGQTVDYVHAHIIGGRPLSWPPG